MRGLFLLVENRPRRDPLGLADGSRVNAWPPVPPPHNPSRSRPCRNCFAAVPAGSAICPVCGAANDFAPAAERAKNPFATLGGVAAMLAVVIGGALLLVRPAGDGATLAVLPFLLLVLGSFVVLVRTERRSPWRAFAFAALMTVVVLLGVLAIAAGALFFVCLASLRGGH